MGSNLGVLWNCVHRSNEPLRSFRNGGSGQENDHGVDAQGGAEGQVGNREEGGY
jgi:hypothetical protein